ncbi:response regulator transcription factor [Pontiella agarivorans]|uniref:Response regulator transcription factor n=1 Tax=Pontiella agarivorans TaxID=3038953 RepID=A0ABU5N138_9BACT|nr:response regulator transcription factor [Pontiella agarivorans]MDZ8120157.1 response regulator transcription factor [Pontiella agarivorans]
MHLLIAEDSQRISATLAKGLRESEYDVTVVGKGSDALTCFNNRKPDLILLDLGLPDMDGLDVLNRIRETDPILPVILITARDKIDDRVRGLDAGADDYLVKPFAFAELQARIRALLRRGKKPADTTIKIADLEIDPVRRKVDRAGCSIELTPREFDILYFLASRTGEPVPREMLAREVLQTASHSVSYDNIIDVHISNLRKKIDTGAPVKLLHTLRGIGFTLEERS